MYDVKKYLTQKFAQAKLIYGYILRSNITKDAIWKNENDWMFSNKREEFAVFNCFESNKN